MCYGAGERPSALSISLEEEIGSDPELGVLMNFFCSCPVNHPLGLRASWELMGGQGL